MSTISFADVVHQIIDFSEEDPAEKLVLDLIDCAWFQRLRDISQTANTRLVYMFSEHSRFGHSIGVAYLAKILMEKLKHKNSEKIAAYRAPVLAASILHDIGHLAPGSHTAFKSWYPTEPDTHEEISVRILEQDEEINNILTSFNPELPSQVAAILHESESTPPWTWEIVSGGGWNVDRGNWCITDSLLAGVSYGKYNIPALIESMLITDDHHLALKESRLDAMMHFALSRHAMYKQIYQHRVLLASDMINKAIVARARDLGPKLPFADETMKAVLESTSPLSLDLQTIFCMRESWWRYHILRWSQGTDPILSDLCSRLLNRRLFKTIRIQETEDLTALVEKAQQALIRMGFDPQYYLHQISTSDVQAGDSKNSMLVRLDDGRVKQLSEAEPLFSALIRESKSGSRRWLALPVEAKLQLGRLR